MLRPKNTIIWKSIPFLLEDQRYSLLSRITVFGQSSGTQPLYLHARNEMSLPQRALRENKNYHWSFKRKGEFHLIVFFASIPRQLVIMIYSICFLNPLAHSRFLPLDNVKRAWHRPFTSTCLIGNPKSEIKLKWFIMEQVWWPFSCSCFFVLLSLNKVFLCTIIIYWTFAEYSSLNKITLPVAEPL